MRAAVGRPALLDALAGRTPVTGWERLSEWDVGPELGLHLDVARREFGFWTAAVFYGTVDEIAACWPGRQVEFWEDRHEEHALRWGSAFRMHRFEEL
ncbi:hypothetical protein [Lentzea sp. NPDC003310]|uniref:hypothetical protein n=1 Tax=Lentzea sp. NPDC003310 TaxID=3154447 RepID=UPI0033B99B27